MVMNKEYMNKEYMNSGKFLRIYLSGAFGQIIIVCIAVLLFRLGGVAMDYTTLPGITAIAVGGFSTALWGTICSVKYRKSDLKTVFFDFFGIKQSCMNYLLVLLFLCIDFLPAAIVGTIKINVWYLPFLMFIKHIAFGGLEEIGWRYFFQPALQEKLSYIPSTIITFAAWGIWHCLYFFVDGSIYDVDMFGFLLGLLTNCFILSSLYNKTNSLWLCVMTHSLINVFSQLIICENDILSCVCRAAIIVIAIVVSSHTKSDRSALNKDTSDLH